MDNSQLSDIQEMTMILAQYKSLYLKNPTQAEISSIFKQRKEIRNSPQNPIQPIKQLF
jgi:hypothetical protein